MITEHLPLPKPGTARVRFAVVNLPLKRDLRCGPFLLSPVKDVDRIVRRLKRMKVTGRSAITAVGTYSLSNPPPKEPWLEVGLAIRAMDRLLTFAHRCRVQIVRPTLEDWTDGEWVSRIGPPHFPDDGYPSPRPWYFRQEELEGFLSRNFPKFVDAEYAEATGLVLALAFYDAIFSDRATEVQYMKTWSAFEILFSCNAKTTELLSGPGFKKLCRLLKQALEQAVKEEILRAEEHEAMTEKLGELNRLSAARQAQGFLDRIFAEYPSQNVTVEEIRAFVKVRNDITHRGEMQPKTHGLVRSLHGKAERGIGAKDYGPDLARAQRLLQALFERVVLAMLEEHPRLMDVSWREIKTSR